MRLRWLQELGRDGVAHLLELRPDLRQVIPQTLESLAQRSASPSSVLAAFADLDLFVAQVCAAAVGLGPLVTREELAAVLEDVEIEHLVAPLTALAQRAIVGLDGDFIETTRSLQNVFGRPLGLGASAVQLLDDRPARFCTDLGRLLGVDTAGRKGEVTGKIAAVLGDRDRVLAVLATAPDDARALLEELTWSPTIESYSAGSWVYWPDRKIPGPAAWLERHALLLPLDAHLLELPREIGLILRGPGWTIKTQREQPACAAGSVPVADIDVAASAAADATVRAIGSILRGLDLTPLPLLKTAAVGVRELAQVGAGVDKTDVDAGRLLNLAGELGLVGHASSIDRLVPTKAADGWLERTTAERWRALVQTWLTSPRFPSIAGVTLDGRRQGALVYDDGLRENIAARRTVLETLCELPVGTSIEPSRLIEALLWRKPALHSENKVPVGLLIELHLREMEMLGLVALSAATTAGRLVAAGGLEGAAKAIAAHTVAAVAGFTLQADQTVVVAGALADEVDRTLRLLADVESRGQATVLRISQGSLRRALDAGETSMTIRAFLETHATKGLPQALGYLIDDVARRHGGVRVGSTRTFVRADDVTLIAEIARTKRLGKLGLVAIAPTVLVSARTSKEVLAALRDAGFLPVGESAGGKVEVTRPAHERAAYPSRGPTYEPSPPLLLDSTAVARKLFTRG